jgi:hypothetical protein
MRRVVMALLTMTMVAGVISTTSGAASAASGWTTDGRGHWLKDSNHDGIYEEIRIDSNRDNVYEYRYLFDWSGGLTWMNLSAVGTNYTETWVYFGGAGYQRNHHDATAFQERVQTQRRPLELQFLGAPTVLLHGTPVKFPSTLSRLRESLGPAAAILRADGVVGAEYPAAMAPTTNRPRSGGSFSGWYRRTRPGATGSPACRAAPSLETRPMQLEAAIASQEIGDHVVAGLNVFAGEHIVEGFHVERFHVTREGQVVAEAGDVSKQRFQLSDPHS